MAKQKETAGGASGRTRTRERRREREREKRRQQQITLVIVIVVVIVLAFGGFLIANQPAEAPVYTGSATLYEGIERSKTEEGFPLLGDPNSLIEVKEYSSFDCSHCAIFHEEILPALLDRVRDGEINFIFVPLYGTGGVNNGIGAAKTAICAGEQGKFWEMHDTLFSWQSLYGVDAFTQNRLMSGVDNLGLDRSLYNQCLGGDVPTNVLNAMTTEIRELGDDYVGTPSVVVNGVLVETADLEGINAAIDEALGLRGADEPEATPEVTEEAAAEATEAVTPEATDVEEIEEEVTATEEAAVEATEAVTPEATDVEEIEEEATATEEATAKATKVVTPEATEGSS